MKRELQLAALVDGALLLVGAFVLLQDEGPVFASKWLLLTSILVCFVWLQCWRRRELNRADLNSPVYPVLGWANHITLGRGALIAACGGFLWPAATTLAVGWICAPLYTVAAILDRVDGFVARRSGRTTLLGTELDTVVDALGLLVAPLLAISLGKIHWSYLLVSAAYYLFQFGLYWRERHGHPTFPLAPSKLRRVLAGFQMGFIAVVLWPPFLAPMTLLIGVAFMIPVLIGFCIDWFVVSGKIQPQLSATAAVFNKLAVLSTTVFQPVLRVVLLVGLFMFSQQHDLRLLPQDGGLWSATLLNYLLLICAAMIALGFAGRMGALLLLCLLAWHFPVVSVEGIMKAVIVCAVWILLLGCGRFSLWQDDDRWVARYDG
ncbi:MAG: CDP-alcohol phosphatidyltransferase family protein [Pseudomonadota bacterium]